MKSSLLLSSLVLSLVWIITITTANVVIETKANWNDTPLSMESMHRDMNHLNQSIGLISLAQSFLSKQDLSLLQFALDVRYYSPMVNLQLTKLMDHHPSISKDLKSSSFFVSKESSLLSNDHWIDGNKADREHCEFYHVIHADVTCSNARSQLLNFLKNKKSNEEKRNCLVFRHVLKSSNTNSPLTVSASDFYMVKNISVISQLLSVRGYGVELQLKDMEYKQVDLATLESSHQTNKKSTNESAADIKGVLFPVLNKKYPQLEADLLAFRHYLQKSGAGGDMKRIQPWQLANIGLKVLYNIFQEREAFTEQLNTLVNLSQNFPLHVHELVHSQTEWESAEEVKSQYQRFEMDLEMEDPNNPSSIIRRNAIYVNGLQLDVSKLNIFSLYNILAKEQFLMRKLNYYGLNNSGIHSVLYSPNEHEAQQRPRFSWVSAPEFQQHVIYANNIEQDERYRNNFPPSLKTMLQPSIFGQMRFCRRNILTAIYIVNPLDPEETDTLEKLTTSLNFYWKGYPVRIGIVLMPNVINSIEMSVGAHESENTLTEILLEDQSSKLIAHVERLCKQHGSASGLQYLVSRKWVNSLPDIELTDEERETLLNRHRLMNEQYGLNSQNVLMFNGVLYETKGEIGDRLFGGAMREQYEDILDLIRTNRIVDTDVDLLKRIIEVHKSYKRYNPLVFNERNANYVAIELPFSNNMMTNEMFKYSSDIINTKNYFAKNTFIICDNNNALIEQVIPEYLGYLSTVSTRILYNYAPVCSQYFTSKIGGIITPSGRRIALGNLQDIMRFNSEDLQTLSEQARNVFNPLFNRLYSMLETEKKETDAVAKSNIMYNIVTLMSSIQQGHDDEKRRDVYTDIQSYKYIISNDDKDGNDNELNLDIFVIMNPLSRFAQKYSSILRYLNGLKGIRLSILLNPEIDTSSMPLKSLYRFTIDSNLIQFNELNNLTGIYTLAMDTPESWLVESTYAEYDLDNLNVVGDCLNEQCYIRFQLEHIVVTGSCMDLTSQMAPRGLQLELVPKVIHDISKSEQEEENSMLAHSMNHKDVTLVMANFGYFQLKANSSTQYVIQLPSYGRHSELFSIYASRQFSFYDQQLTSHIYSEENERATREHIVSVDNFDGPFVQLYVKRNPGKEKEELLTGDEEDDADGTVLKNIISSIIKGVNKKKEKIINIFSIASGHMYERLLKIMILSVTKNMKNARPKFWFLKQFLSPQFKKILPQLAEHYNFQYGLVSYAWPHWLHRQQQKQRIIWAYKVLFLDVLFPLREVKKIIFVDADQVCRTDMTELWDFDLKGNSLAYTPFCSDRKDMEGFRFWNQGYWKNYLRGKPYHISALFVVDIAQFRKKYHGDQFRMLYDSLSKDPNSLSNLDQDLPNYAQHHVPITSLPQSWLWCETWCSEESKAKAKTIDLCNNPKTKEHKLTSARRIISEWQSYDDEIRQFEVTQLKQ